VKNLKMMRKVLLFVEEAEKRVKGNAINSEKD
jgi:hypothetical protein